jgi:cell division protein FtsX
MASLCRADEVGRDLLGLNQTANVAILSKQSQAEILTQHLGWNHNRIEGIRG